MRPVQNGAMDELKKYLKEAGLTRTAFAKLAGVDQSLVSRYITGKLKPSLDRAVAIERATDGKVPPRVWVPDA